MSGFLACALGRMAGTGCHWRRNLPSRKAPLALIVQGFPRFRTRPLAQKDKTLTFAGQYDTEPEAGHRMLCAGPRCSIRATALAAIATVACHSPVWADDSDYHACLPDRLHPVSAKILEAFLDGRLTEMDFRWGFHLPNSDYLTVSECILAVLHDDGAQSCTPEDPAEGGSDSCFSF